MDGMVVYGNTEERVTVNEESNRSNWVATAFDRRETVQ